MRITIASIVVGLCMLAGSGASDAGGRKLVVVVAKGSSVTNISSTDLKRCFTGVAIDGGGTKLVPFNASPNAPDRVAFDSAVLGMSPDDVGRFWTNRRVRGQGNPPRSLPSPAYVAKVAAKFPGAISYLPADQMTPDIQPVAINGIAYTDARYNLITN